MKREEHSINRKILKYIIAAIFVACGMVNNYTLLIPVALACLIAKFTSRMILPYTVYSYTVPSAKPVEKNK